MSAPRCWCGAPIVNGHHCENGHMPYRDQFVTISEKGLRAIVIAAAVALSGCSAMHSRSELAWQTLHAIDAAQTYAIADSPCFQEGNPITRELIGADPSRESVVAWAVGSAVLHAGVSSLLETRGYDRALRIWQFVTISEKGLTVASNHNVGVRIGERCR